MLETHDDLHQKVKTRASCVLKYYKATQIAALIASGCLAVMADAYAQSTLVIANSSSCIGLGGIGILALGALGHVHSLISQTKWGYSASSLQYIYKAQPDNYNADGQLVCINCKANLPTPSLLTAMLQRKPDAGCSCGNCGFKLWPQSRAIGQLFHRVSNPI